MIYQVAVQGSYKMRRGWVLSVLILAMPISNQESARAKQGSQDAPAAGPAKLGEAWFDCLHSTAKQLAGRKKPTEADAMAAVPKCKAEEDAIRDFFERGKSALGGAASTDPYARIPTDDLIAEFRRRFIWEINYPISPKR
jgi:hypothetical protein